MIVKKGIMVITSFEAQTPIKSKCDVMIFIELLCILNNNTLKMAQFSKLQLLVVWNEI